MGIREKIKDGIDKAFDLGKLDAAEPSHIIKNLIDNAVSNGKKAVDFIAKHYEPYFSLDYITGEKEIVKIYKSLKNKPEQLDKLRRLVTNNLNTVYLSGEINESIRNYLTQQIKAKNKEDVSPADKKIKISLEDLDDTNNEFYLILKAVNCLKERGVGEEFLNIINKLEKINSNWNHPLLTQYVIKAKKGNCSKEELKRYCNKALYANPLDSSILELAEGFENDKGKIVYQQVRSLLMK